MVDSSPKEGAQTVDQKDQDVQDIADAFTAYDFSKANQPLDQEESA